MRIVYLHGFASGPSSRKARFFRARFAGEGVALMVPDLTEGAFEQLTVSGQLRVIGRVAGSDPVSLIGSSLGGYLAALYAARHPEVVRLVLLAPAFAFPGRWSLELGPERMESWRTTGRLPVFDYVSGGMRDLGYQLILDAAQYEDFPDFQQSALIFHGRRDPVVPLRFSEEFAASHPNAELHAVDSGHELTDVLDLMWPHVRAFLLPARSAGC